jgi:hypothetical protein
MPPTTEHASKASARPRRLAAVALTAGAIAVLGGCANPLQHAAAASPSATASSAAKAAKAAQAAVADRREQACASQAAWNTRARTFLKAIYADTGALAADAQADNAPGVRKAGHKLASDAVAAATLPLPVVDPADWKTLVSASVTAGSALAGGEAITAVPQLETGSSAISAFTTSVAKCAPASS